MKNRPKTHFDFDDVAGRYDRFNHWFSLGIDHLWRRHLVKAANPKIQQRVLDVCCGTGDLVFSFLKHSATKHVIGLDISEPMLELARQKQDGLSKKVWLRNKTIDWKMGDAAHISLEDRSVDFITCAFGVRNITDRKGFLEEAARLLKQRGKVYVLEFSLPVNPILRGLYRVYLNRIMPLLGRFVLGSKEPLAYLARSIHHWHTQVDFTAEISNSGLSLVRKVPLTCGIVTLWVIRKV
ncbi:MAG: ubiquinone/menaquinone biosynthesis methyltransferase [Planctomycetota bacterium]